MLFRSAVRMAQVLFGEAFVDAPGGTVFLDGIGELPAADQPKLLRALEHKAARVVAALAKLQG